MEPERSLSCSQEHNTDPILTLYLFKINFDILPSTPRSSLCLFYFMFFPIKVFYIFIICPGALHALPSSSFVIRSL
jgi:hypothetical protein